MDIFILLIIVGLEEIDLSCSGSIFLCRTLMGAWIETRNLKGLGDGSRVAPLWVRGLKHNSADLLRLDWQSHPYGCVD